MGGAAPTRLTRDLVRDGCVSVCFSAAFPVSKETLRRDGVMRTHGRHVAGLRVRAGGWDLTVIAAHYLCLVPEKRVPAAISRPHKMKSSE